MTESIAEGVTFLIVLTVMMIHSGIVMMAAAWLGFGGWDQ